ncbi:hypothetical protein TWF694_003265 [Orbilia ellipsospora]|uniref:Uncharacterized protein n=1 Tax=Orbilia ellipsospora TaxID=2528407 RepID=A0AAV9X737_9PEZI
MDFPVAANKHDLAIPVYVITLAAVKACLNAIPVSHSLTHLGLLLLASCWAIERVRFWKSFNCKVTVATNHLPWLILGTALKKKRKGKEKMLQRSREASLPQYSGQGLPISIQGKRGPRSYY